jgi:hypothetical protein
LINYKNEEIEMGGFEEKGDTEGVLAWGDAGVADRGRQDGGIGPVL